MKNLPFLLLILCLQTNIVLQAQWTSLGSGIDASPRQIFSMHAVDDQIIWAVTGFEHVNFTPAFEFTKSMDGGQTWQPGTLNIDPNLYHFDIFALDAQTAWITTADELNPISGKIFKTTDGGATWVHQFSAFTEFNQTPAGIYFWNSNEGVAFGATCHDSFNDQIAIYYTLNGGDSWQEVKGESMPDQLPGEGICFWSGNSNYAVVEDTMWFFSSRNRIFRSTNRGISWKAFDVDLENSYIISMAFKDALNGIVTGFLPNRIARTTDGGETWVSKNIQYSGRATEIEYIPGTRGTYLIQDGDVLGGKDMLITYDNGNTWKLYASNENLSCLEFLSPTVGFAGGLIQAPDKGGIFRWNGDLSNRETIFASPLQKFEIPHFELFPVPAKDKLNIELPDEWIDPYRIELFDVQGKKLIRVMNTTDRSLDITDLEPGVYVLKVIDREQILSKKFIKQ